VGEICKNASHLLKYIVISNTCYRQQHCLRYCAESRNKYGLYCKYWR